MKTFDQMLPHQQRVVQEQQALEGNIDRLRNFLTDVRFNTVPGDEQERLHRQITHMSSYNEVLIERIKAF